MKRREVRTVRPNSIDSHANGVIGSRRSRYDSDSESESPPRHRRKSLGEQALAAIGLGSAAGAASGSHRGDRDRARSRSRHGGRRGDSRSRSRSRSVDQKEKIQQAVKAALTAGAIEAFRSRKEPGGWQGQGKRAITAAIGAAGINGAVDRDPAKHSTRHTVEAVLGGLAGNRLINGPRENSRSRSRTRGSRDEGGGFGGAGALAAGGLAALAAKTISDRSKSKDREPRGRRYSSDDESPPPRRSRSKSVSAYVSRGLDKGMAAIGLGNNDKHRDDYKDERSGRRQYDDDGYAPRPRGGGGPSRSSSSSSFDSEQEEKKRKKMVGKEYLTAGLATVATIHAAHSVYQSKEKRDKRHKEVMEGKMTPEQASKLKSKARLQDVASIGIAALGIKGAVSEWKEVKESREECHKFQEELQERREKHYQRRQSRSSRKSESDMSRRYQGDYYQRGPMYQDANPYGASALPPPPIGAPPMRY